MDNKIEYTKSGDVNIAMLFDEPKDADKLVIILHSFTAGKDGNTERQIAEELSSRNVSSVRFDFTGIGDSMADISLHTISKCIEDTKAVYNIGREKGYSDIALYGFSMGGNVALNVMIRNQEKFSKFAFNAPAANIPAIFESYGPELMDNWKNVGYYPYLNQMNNRVYNINFVFYEDSKKYVITPDKVKDIRAPTFFMHGTSDTTVPYQSSVELHRHLKNSVT